MEIEITHHSTKLLQNLERKPKNKYEEIIINEINKLWKSHTCGPDGKGIDNSIRIDELNYILSLFDKI